MMSNPWAPVPPGVEGTPDEVHGEPIFNMVGVGKFLIYMGSFAVAFVMVRFMVGAL